jgi:hypothetical protein
MSSKTESKCIENLANVPSSLGDLLKDADVQRMILRAMGEVVRSGPIKDSASVLPQRPAPISNPPTATRNGWREEAKLEPPCGADALRRLDEGVNALMGVKPKTQD